MSLLVFWLIPVVLLVVLILLVLDYRRANIKPELLIIEPLGKLITLWRLARIIGPEAKIHRVLNCLRQTHLSDSRLIDLVLSDQSLNQRKEESTHLITDQPLPMLGTRRVLEVADRRSSIVVGSYQTVEPFLDSQTLPDDWPVLKKEIDLAAEHGFLTLLLGLSHRSRPEGRIPKHQYLGAVMLEAQVDRSAAKQLSSHPWRLVSCLPTGLVRWLSRELGEEKRVISAKAIGEINSPLEREKAYADNRAFAEADFTARYQMIRLCQRRFRCRVLSLNGEDERLPV